MPTIRLACVADAAPIQRIYAPFCLEDCPTSFECEPPSVEEMARRIAKVLERHPWLVCEREGEVVGYVYGSMHSDRAAYGWSVNVSAYLAEGYRGQGIGRALYTSLFALLTLQGYVNIYAGITLPNPSSVGLHEAMGFERVGIYRRVGFKCGAWHDTGWWQRPLVDWPNRPGTPLTTAEARSLEGWTEAMESGLPLLRSG